MRVGGLGCCGETDPLVTFGELDVEESYQSLEKKEWLTDTEKPLFFNYMTP